PDTDGTLCRPGSAGQSSSASRSAPISCSRRSKFCSISPPASSSSGRKNSSCAESLAASALALRPLRSTRQLREGSRNRKRRSVRRYDIRVLGELHRRGEIILHEPFELLDAHRLRQNAELRQSFLNDRHVQSLLGLVVQLVDDGTRRLRRHRQSSPE